MEFLILVETMMNFISKYRECSLKCQQEVARFANRNDKTRLARNVSQGSTLRGIFTDVGTVFCCQDLRCQCRNMHIEHLQMEGLSA